MKLLLDILMHIMTIMVVCYWPHAGFGKTSNKFSCSKSPWITKKRIIQRNIPLRTYTPRGNPLLSVYPQITQILDQSLSSVTCPHVAEGPKALILWLSPLWGQKNMDFRHPPGIHFSQKYDHIWPQGRPHEKEFKLFSYT